VTVTETGLSPGGVNQRVIGDVRARGLPLRRGTRPAGPGAAPVGGELSTGLVGDHRDRVPFGP
jgi:hypothetical protein